MEGAQLSEAVINVKLWSADYARVMGAYLQRLLPSCVAQCEGEALGTLEGSGCAMVNVARALSALSTTTEPSGAALGLLAAGEGSRLWGVSAAMGFVKGLLNVFGRTLIEHSIVQARQLVASAPAPVSQWVLLTGTDNIFRPSVATLQLADEQRTPFSSSPSRGIHTFSIPIRVRQSAQSSELLPGVCERLAQLGIMFADKTGSSVMFVEKPTPEETRDLVSRFDADFVFVNAFIFALSRDANKSLADIYNAQTSTGVPLYHRKEFDWSGNVLSPLSFCHAHRELSSADAEALWLQNRTAASRQYFADDSDWLLVLRCAKKFYDAFGPLRVLNCGAESVWFDCGLSADVLDLCRLAQQDTRDGQILREMTGVELPIRVASTVADGVQLGRNVVLVNSHITAAGTRVADDTVLINSRIDSADLLNSAGPGCLFYGVHGSPKFAQPLAARTVCFGVPKSSDGKFYHGQFPVDANAKKGGLLEKPFEGDIGASFRQLQKEKDVSLSLILETQ